VILVRKAFSVIPVPDHVRNDGPGIQVFGGIRSLAGSLTWSLAGSLTRIPAFAGMTVGSTFDADLLLCVSIRMFVIRHAVKLMTLARNP